MKTFIKRNKKNILGIASILMVIFMVITFIKTPSPSNVYEDEPVEDKSTGLKADNEASKPKSSKDKAKDTQSKKDVPKDLPNVKTSDWQLDLVNAEHPIREECKTLTVMPNGFEIDKRIAQDYYALENEARKAGHQMVVVSSFRSVAQQEKVKQDDIAKYMAQGFSAKESKQKSDEYVTVPGTSEHHTGLALDVIDAPWSDGGNGLEEAFYNTPGGKWLDENVEKFGFVIRYPKHKEDITHINYEPWHIRYVGKENAKYMNDKDLTLEEYVEVLKEAKK